MNDKVKKQHFKALKWVHRGGHSIISQSFYDLFLLSFLEVFPSDQVFCFVLGSFLVIFALFFTF